MEFTGRIIQSPDAEPFYGRLVLKNGRITELVKLRGKPGPGTLFIAPGFIDAHTHPLELGLQQLFVNLGKVKSVDELLTALSARTEAMRESGILLGFNLDPENLAESRYPNRCELDRVTQKIPTLVYRIDGHSACANSAGLELAFGHQIGKENSGILFGQAYEQASQVFKRKLGPETIMAALESAADIAASNGVTTLAALVGTNDTKEQKWQILLDALSGLKIRTVPFMQTRNPELACRFGLPRVGGCVLVDGSFGSHTAALTRNYHDSPNNRGLCYFSDKELLAFLKQANELQLQTALHAIGDRAIEQLVRCHESLACPGKKNPLRHRIEHTELLDASLIERIANLGLILCVQPAFEARWGGPNRLYAKRLGNRWRKTNPYRSLLNAGILLAGGSDAPITPIDPFGGIWAAIKHPNKQQEITGQEAFAMFTTAAAYSLGLELTIGRLEPGYQADFVLLTKDPRFESDSRLIATYRAGNCLYQDKKQKKFST